VFPFTIYIFFWGGGGGGLCHIYFICQWIKIKPVSPESEQREGSAVFVVTCCLFSPRPLVFPAFTQCVKKNLLVCVTVCSPGESAPRFPSSRDSVWRRSSGGGWTRWEFTECLESQLTSRHWRRPSIPVSSVWFCVMSVFPPVWLLCRLPPRRQQRRLCDDEGDGRERHRRNTEAVFPRAAGASFHRRLVPQLCRRHRSVAASLFWHHVPPSCETSTFMLCAFALQLSLTAWPRRAACSTCCCLCQRPTWWPSSSCSTTLKGKSIPLFELSSISVYRCVSVYVCYTLLTNSNGWLSQG